MIRKSRRKRKIRILKRIVFWGIIIFISCTGIYFYRKYKDIQLENIVSHTPQNDALQKWKEGREKKQEAYHFIRTGLRNATGKDSLHLIRIRDSLRMQEQETNFLFLKEQGNNTLGTFMRKMVRGSLTEEQQKLLDESLQKEIH